MIDINLKYPTIFGYGQRLCKGARNQTLKCCKYSASYVLFIVQIKVLHRADGRYRRASPGNARYHPSLTGTARHRTPHPKNTTLTCAIFFLQGIIEVTFWFYHVSCQNIHFTASLIFFPTVVDLIKLGSIPPPQPP